jgi:hypothetical protein
MSEAPEKSRRSAEEECEAASQARAATTDDEEA